jgi:hypothetical protein
MTYSTRSAAVKWGKRREVELEDPNVLKLAMHGETTLASLIRWYIDSFQNISKWQRSKQSALVFLEKHEIGKEDVLKLTSERLVEHVRKRRESGVSGSTASNDLTWIGNVLETAKASRGTPVNVTVVSEARLICNKLRLISRSKRRARRPTTDELQRLNQYFFHRDRHACSVIPMRTIMWFAIESTRREAEICRLEWEDNDPNGRTRRGLPDRLTSLACSLRRHYILCSQDGRRFVNDAEHSPLRIPPECISSRARILRFNRGQQSWPLCYLDLEGGSTVGKCTFAPSTTVWARLLNRSASAPARSR